ncbi:putative glutathione S-transferase 6 [Ditylenchus destructor]|uniref:glutathione transferase n=1 Tax=Ditylenchus destructor TaxID=166010 RepID=A0AAD4QZL4_9BILA|nr:putative glutathione S-transferase 6 [Ditylenchus destructor]
MTLFEYLVFLLLTVWMNGIFAVPNQRDIKLLQEQDLKDNFEFLLDYFNDDANYSEPPPRKHRRPTRKNGLKMNHKRRPAFQTMHRQAYPQDGTFEEEPMKPVIVVPPFPGHNKRHTKPINMTKVRWIRSQQSFEDDDGNDDMMPRPVQLPLVGSPHRLEDSQEHRTKQPSLGRHSFSKPSGHVAKGTKFSKIGKASPSGGGIGEPATQPLSPASPSPSGGGMPNGNIDGGNAGNGEMNSATKKSGGLPPPLPKQPKVPKQTINKGSNVAGGTPAQPSVKGSVSNKGSPSSPPKSPMPPQPQQPMPPAPMPAPQLPPPPPAIPAPSLPIPTTPPPIPKQNYKLIYFDARGICEPIRLLFHYTKIPFEDARISRKQWLALKDSTVYGKVPILEVDGKPLTYCHTISRYLARTFGLAGKDNWEQAKVDEISDFHSDVAMDLQPYLYVVAGFHQGDRDGLRKAVFLPGVEKHFPVYVNILKQSGSGFFISSGLTWIDFVISEYMTTIKHFEPAILDKYPTITKFVRKVQSLPQIFDYVANREHQPV